MCSVEWLLLLVRAEGRRRSKTFWYPRFRWSPRRRGHLCGEGANHGPRKPHQRHVKANTRTLGMRAVISSLRSSRQPVRQRIHPATQLGSPRLYTSTAKHAIHRPLRRPVSLVQHRRFHSHLEEPTIYALSTASGRAAIAVIRVSGPACRQVRLGQSLQYARMLIVR